MATPNACAYHNRTEFNLSWFALCEFTQHSSDQLFRNILTRIKKEGEPKVNYSPCASSFNEALQHSFVLRISMFILGLIFCARIGQELFSFLVFLSKSLIKFFPHFLKTKLLYAIRAQTKTNSRLFLDPF